MMVSQSFDVLVIGAGPAGYVCAIRASQLGFRVACVEKNDTLGGTCLNVGCIPSKALLHSSHLYSQATSEFKGHGITAGDMSIDIGALMKRKNQIVGDLTKGISFLFKKNKVTHLIGTAKLLGDGKASITANGQSETITAKHIIIATGSESSLLPGIQIDEEKIVSSTGALALTEVPRHFAVIGGGYIGLEMASVWSRLGAKATVIEFADSIVPAMDQEISKTFMKILKGQGFDFQLETKVTNIHKDEVGLTLNLEKSSGESLEPLQCDVVLVAVGRTPYTKDLDLPGIGVKQDKRGFIEINDRFETSVQNIYAIGDVVSGPMLAHKGEEEGVAVVEFLAGQKPHIDYNLIPGVVYTHPEVATVGKTEKQLKDQKIDYVVGKFPFIANSRAKAIGETEGFVKILADKRTDKIYGAHIIGPEAGNMIHEIIVAMEFGGSAEDIARTCHAHPSFNEAIKEAALSAEDRVIHS